MALIISLFLILTAILALLAGAAQAWGVDSREDSRNSYPSHVGLL